MPGWQGLRERSGRSIDRLSRAVGLLAYRQTIHSGGFFTSMRPNGKSSGPILVDLGIVLTTASIRA